MQALSHENMCVEVGIHTFLTLEVSNQLPLYSRGQNPWCKLDRSVSWPHSQSGQQAVENIKIVFSCLELDSDSSVVRPTA